MVLWVGDDTNTPSIILAYMKFQCSQVSYFKTEIILLVAQITTCWSHRIDWDSWMMHFICTFHQTFNKGLIPENSFKNSIKIALFIFAIIQEYHDNLTHFRGSKSVWNTYFGWQRQQQHRDLQLEHDAARKYRVSREIVPTNILAYQL